MNLKNCKYMKSAEFKTRQAWLAFTDAIGIAYQVMADVKEQAADWFKAWVKEFKTPRAVKKPEQLSINFFADTKNLRLGGLAAREKPGIFYLIAQDNRII